MLEKLKSSYPAPRRSDDSGQVVHRNGVPPELFPPGCLTDADRWDYTFQSAPELERWLERALGKNSAGALNCPPLHPASRPKMSWSWEWTRGEVLELSRRGWHEVASQVGPLALDVSNSELGTTHEPGLENDVEGCDVDVEAFIRGEPESMRAFREVRTSGQSVTLVIDAFISWAVNGSVHFRRGAAVCAAVLALQAQNIAVSVLLRYEGRWDTYRDKDVDMGDRYKPGKNDHGYATRGTFSCWLHRPGDVLDVSRLLVWLAHPGWLRGIFVGGFSALVGADNGGQGIPPEVKEGVLVVPAASSGVFATPESAEAFIRQAAEAAL